MTVDDLIDSLVAFKRLYGGDHKVYLIETHEIDIVDIKRLGKERKCLLIPSEDLITKQDMLDSIQELKDQLTAS